MKNILYAVFLHSKTKKLKAQVSIAKKYTVGSSMKAKQTRNTVNGITKGMLILKKIHGGMSSSELSKPYPQCSSLRARETDNIMKYQITNV